MEFNGPPPPMNDAYFPSLLSEEVWQRLESNQLDLHEDLKGWQDKLAAEKSHMDGVFEERFDSIRTWVEETDFVVRMLRCVGQTELAGVYKTEEADQMRYEAQVERRRMVLEAVLKEVGGLLEQQQKETSKAQKKGKKQPKKKKNSS